MKGIVLCGGQSLRMGKDKGLLIGSRKITWAQQAFALLTRLEIEVAFSINDHQNKSYKRMFYFDTLIPDNKTLVVKGPLTGILSAHLKFPKDNLIVLACDMIEMRQEVMVRLYNEFDKQSEYEAYVYRDKGMTEPLCAIYTAKALKKIADKAQKNLLEKHSMMYVLDQLKVNYLPIEPEVKKAFLNMNTVSDLQYV